MKLLVSAADFDREFSRLIETYNEYYWATAWATISPTNFNDLKKRKDRIKKIIVGLHFYQTHPDFIAEFLNTKTVRFIKQTEGTFHPKVYLFQNNDKDWELLVGSGNFTNEAFMHNTEAVFLLDNKSDKSNTIRQDAFDLFNSSWNNATYFDKDELVKYRRTWEKLRPKRNSLKGTYGGEKPKKPIYNVPVSNMTWDEFIKQVKKDRIHSMEQRIAVLDAAQDLFKQYGQFSKMPEKDRKAIAATYYGDKVNGLEWKLFGSMWGAGEFKAAIGYDYKDISRGLDQIPLTGNLTKTHYDNFLSHFRKTFPTGNPLATATRLLAMKRPDTFVCIDNKNKKELCNAFGLTASHINLDNYWDEIIERIFDSIWWQTPTPKTEKQNKVANGRSAFLDALYYEP